jgi:hypothetical protein
VNALEGTSFVFLLARRYRRQDYLTHFTEISWQIYLYPNSPFADINMFHIAVQKNVTSSVSVL